MNYRDRIRKELLTNDTGQSIHYHKLNELKHDRKVMILRLLDEMDSADEYCKKLYIENMKLRENRNKAVNILESISCDFYDYECDKLVINKDEISKLLQTLNEGCELYE